MTERCAAGMKRIAGLHPSWSDVIEPFTYPDRSSPGEPGDDRPVFEVEICRDRMGRGPVEPARERFKIASIGELAAKRRQHLRDPEPILRSKRQLGGIGKITGFQQLPDRSPP